ncbi:hypothetical protein Plhal703r1_c19g0086471 [Plasmopara halstedii]
MISCGIVVACVIAFLIFALALKLYLKKLSASRTVCSQPPSAFSVVEINNFTYAGDCSFSSYQVARYASATKTMFLSPILEETRPSRTSTLSCVKLDDPGISAPQSPVVLTSLVSPFNDVCSPPTQLAALPPVGFV